MSDGQSTNANLRWAVSINSEELSLEGVTLKLSPHGAYITCANPLGLNEVFDMTLYVPDSDSSIKVKVEVVFSNKYGPNDDISPRGMGVRFINISGEDRQIIAKQILNHLESNNVSVDPKKLRGLQTLIVDQSEISKEDA